MASGTTSLLQATLGGTPYRALTVLAEANSPISGRSVAAALGVSPTTATAALGKLREAGLAVATREGRADRWRLEQDNPTVAAWLQETGGQPARGVRPKRRAIILTALPEEYQAVEAHLADLKPTRARQTRYQEGQFRGTHIDWTVYVAEIGMGNPAASTELAAAHAAFDPDVALFVGVAASVKPDDLCRGDVVVGSEAYNIHAGKDAIDDGGRPVSLGRPVSSQAIWGLIQLATSVRRTDWTNEVMGGPADKPRNARGKSPRVEVKAIAAGEVVHANLNSPLMERIRSEFNNVAAVDMESYGVYEAAHRLDLPAVAVRGISDSVGDKTASDDRNWQPVAAQHAAGFAFAMLRAAEEQDLGGRRAAPTPEGPAADGPSVDDHLFRLPPAVAIAYEPARRSAQAAADRLIAELADQGPSWREWLDRFRRQPPEEMAEASSGPLWVIIAAYADSHQHEATSWLYEQAAEHTSDTATSAVLFARAALSAAREGNRDRAGELMGRASELTPEAMTLWDLHQAGIDDDGPSLIRLAGRLARPLDLSFLQDTIPTDTGGGDDNDGLDGFVDQLAFSSPELFEQLRYLVAYWAGMALLITNALPEARRVFETLSRGMPSSRPRSAGNAVRGSLVGPRTAPVITQLAKTLCAMATTPGGAEPGFDVDRALDTALDLALTARDRLLDWHGPTVDALQVAVMARTRAGDPRGALRMLLAPPEGTALPGEAQSQLILVIAGELAASTGQADLAFDLAKKIEDPVERHIVTGLAFLNRPDCHHEAAAEFRLAAHDPGAASRPDQQIRALMALSLVEEPTEQEIEAIASFDPETADLVRAQALATAGRSQQAQVIARRYPSEAALMVRVGALLATGEVDRAIEALEHHAREHNDERFLAQAATLAVSEKRLDDAERLANMLVASRDPNRRRIALEILTDRAAATQRWDRVLADTARLIDDAEIPERDPQRDEHVASYRWARANAHYQLRYIKEAYAVIREDPPLRPTTAEQARLTLAVLHFLAPSVETAGDMAQNSAQVTQAEILQVLTAVAKDFPDDEEIVGTCVTISLRLPVVEPADPGQIAKARALQEQFFQRFPESQIIRRITITDTLSDVTEMLRGQFAAGAEEAVRLRRAAWAGQVPLSVYATSLRRSYAEGLIKDALGCYVLAHPDPPVTMAETAAAADALDGPVVVDTSTLFLADAAFGDLAGLRSRFDRLVLPAAQRDDVLAARNSLQLNSPFSMGWDPYSNRPTMHETDEETNRHWRAEADRLVAALELCEVATEPAEGVDREERLWSAPILLAKDKGLPLLADDAALRIVARSEGVPTFSSLGVLHALVSTGEQYDDAIEEAYRRLMALRVAELPLLDRIRDIAATDNWSQDSYAVFLLSRPITWWPIDRGLRIYMDLMRDLEEPTSHGAAAWCTAAIFGACHTVQPPAVLHVASSIAAWTVLNFKRSDILVALVTISPRVIAQFGSGGDFLEALVKRIIETLRQVVPAEHLAGAFLPLIEDLEEEARRQALQVFLSWT